MIMLTTTAVDLDEELVNRALVLTVDEDRAQTRAIHQRQRARRMLDGRLAHAARTDVLALHRTAQCLLEPLTVVNPYAPQLTFIDARTRTRRDREKYLTLIDVVTLLHQHQLARESTRVGGCERGLDVAYVDVTVRDPSMAWVAVSELNPGTAVERDLCVNVSAGPGAAYECGDLRLAHSLPTTRTMGTARAPTLLYSSNAGRAGARIAAEVTLAAGSATPDSVIGCATFSGGSPVCGRWAGSAFTSTHPQRMTLYVDGSALSISARQYASLHAYTFEAVGWFTATGPQSLGSEAGELIVVDRKDSPLGRGWSVAGVEQLFFLDGNRLLWLGGDGSSRVYEPESLNRWRAPNLDRVDLITKADTLYTRVLPNNLRVQFNSVGRHVATVNRLDQHTYFRYDPSGDTLKTIKLALPSSGEEIGGPIPDSLYYKFDYSVPGQVIVTAPPIGTTPRVTTMTRSGGELVSITDPDTNTVTFGHGATAGLVISRTDKLSRHRNFEYGVGNVLASVTTVMGTSPSSSDIVTRFSAGEVAGINDGASVGASVSPDSASTIINGPRSDTTVTRLWLDRYGAPTRIENALGYQTTLERGDPQWPALVTRIEQPNGQIVGAAYDDRGNLRESTDSSRTKVVSGATKYATTKYTWDDRWDFMTSVELPEGERTIFEYDSATGNRIWQQIGTSSLRRTSFGYFPINHLYQYGQAPGTTSRDLVFYDGLGNLTESRTPRGFKSKTVNDKVGRAILTSTQIDTIGIDETAFLKDTIEYDVMDRVLRHTTIGPALNGVAEQKLIIENYYDAEGQLDTLRRRQDPLTPTNVDSLTTHWVYDRAGRRVKEISPDNQADSTVYDAAGNVIKLLGRRLDPTSGVRLAITMKYDSLNRLIERVVPQVTYGSRVEGLATIDITPGAALNAPSYPTYHGATSATTGYTIAEDIATFRYDSMGNMTQADNGDARVRRSYYVDGGLKLDTLIIRTWDEMAGVTWTQHTYGLEYKYDLNGRLIDLKHPYAISALFGGTVIAGTAQDHTSYAYDDETGALATVTDPLSNQYSYAYDLKGQVDTLYQPRSLFEHYQYDDDGNLSFHFANKPESDARHMTLTHDARGKLLSAIDTLVTPPSMFGAAYSGLGYLVRDSLKVQVVTRIGEEDSLRTWEAFTTDAFGNMAVKNSTFTLGTVLSQTTPNDPTTFDARTGRQLAATVYNAADSTHYDLAGNIEFISRQPQSANSPRPFNDRAFYYAADGKVRASEWRTYNEQDHGEGQFVAAFEEYRYDALGRRVAVLARRSCNDYTGTGGLGTTAHLECKQSRIRRTVWMQDRELYEIQMPADSGTPQATVENDTALVHLPVGPGVGNFNPNPYFGRVAFTYGFGVDRPLAVTRMGYTDEAASGGPAGLFTIVPQWSDRGGADDYYIAEAPSGERRLCYPNDATRCTNVYLPEAWSAYYPIETPLYAGSWNGTLLEEKRDATGTLYRRNRSYDPQSGRFTQEDPIGLAGGMNLYGYAEGDPVTYSDPFGLCSNPLAGGWGGLRCLLEDAAAGGMQALRNLGNTLVDRLIQTADNTAGCLRDPVCAVVGTHSLDGMAASASRVEAGGLSAAGRALEKHGSRPGSAFGRATGNAAAKNAAGQAAVEDILTAPGSRRVDLMSGRFKGGVDIYAPDGRGVRYDAKGNFVGLLEPPR